MTIISTGTDGKSLLSDAQKNAVDRCWQEFSIRNKTEADSVEELYSGFNKRCLRCRYCRSDKLFRKRGQRISRCLRCNKTIWLTGGTFFHRVRCVRPWLAAIWFMEHGVSISCSRFHKLLGIAYASAVAIFKKLATVIESQMGADCVAVRSSQFARVICKRSRETPAGKAPFAEEEAFDRRCRGDGITNESSDVSISTGKQDYDRESATVVNVRELVDSTCSLSAEQKKILEILSGGPAYFQVLSERTGIPVGQLSAGLIALELEGLVKRQPGDRYVACDPEPRSETLTSSFNADTNSESKATMVAAAIAFIHINFQGISRKYLQKYLAAYWFHLERNRFPGDWLLERCLQFGAISYRDILAYVSAADVKVAPLPNS
jgi:hypothetical protein